VGLSRYVAPGEVVGIDQSSEVIDQARAYALEKGATKVRFEVSGIYELPFADAKFDLVYAHQLLQHLADPVTALREMSRVLGAGGIIAVRDADYGTMVYYPHDPLLDRWLEIYYRVARANGGEPDAGRRLLGWVQAAGLVDPEVTTSTWTYADPAGRAHWSELWAGRIAISPFAERAQALGVSDPEELESIGEAFRRWAAQADGFCAFLHGEVRAGKAPP
jgi:SAM-dependent methyltransferase